MAFSSCFFHSPISLKIVGYPGLKSRHPCRMHWSSAFTLKDVKNELLGQQFAVMGNRSNVWSFIRGSRAIIMPNHESIAVYRKRAGVCASWFTTSQIASSAFTLGTASVLPFYTLMVVVPKAQLTKKSMESSIPFVVLGLLYAYLLYLSWTPDTIRLMFASKYWLPELPGMAKMFSSEMTLASAWIHLLAVDLFAARQVYLDGLMNKIETRHSISLCLLFCPVGIACHFITKTLAKECRKNRRQSSLKQKTTEE